MKFLFYSLSASGVAAFGHMAPATCPCVGAQGVDMSQAGYYDSSIGSSCKAWDEEFGGDDCTGPNPQEWCAQPWCWVDPNNCGVDSELSTWIPELTYSYAACGGEDAWANSEERARDDVLLGASNCRCKGPRDVDLSVQENGEASDYPNQDIGTYCKTWDLDYPGDDCVGDDKPAWCSNPWCWVDPTECDLDNADSSGWPLHYSYATCGAEDLWSGSEAQKKMKSENM